MKTRRNFYIEDTLWQQICEKAKAEKRSAAGQIEYYVTQGLTGNFPEDHSELVGLLLIEVQEAWKLNNGLYSDVDEKRLRELIEEFNKK